MDRARERQQHRTLASQSQLVNAAAILDRTNGHRARYVVRNAKTRMVVPVAGIDWIDTADNYLRLHVGDRTHMVRGTLKRAEGELDPTQFVRIHRSALVQVSRVVSITRRVGGWYVVAMANGARLRTSRRYLHRVQALKGDAIRTR
jgi:two-component system LytT family response regulator